jgi:hypothetical protein
MKILLLPLVFFLLYARIIIAAIGKIPSDIHNPLIYPSKCGSNKKTSICGNFTNIST